ncbi:MAG: hypothetical protein QOI10_3081 [Solirubrobacterales bacterium]|jgi:hypothetical protein|nr:hypothetical protein [Solirubrobacterales bacterium]
MTKTLIAVAACAAVLLAAGPASAVPGNGNGNAGDNGNGGSSDAAKLCAAQKKADPAAFKAVWGKHAMRDCIRANRDTATDPAVAAEEFQNAAQECRAERAADPAGFAATYGTNHNDHNAFGKCVSTHAQAEETPSA